MRKKIISLGIIFHLSLALTGCGVTTTERHNTLEDKVMNIENIKESDFSLLSTLNSFKSASVNEEYNEPMYQLEKDYIFVFEASEKVSDVIYKAFSVYDNIDYEKGLSTSYAKCIYKDGKVLVVPNSVLLLNEYGSTNVTDGTWGSMNKLYLVQNVDLQTGENLERPIVTPFSIRHDLDAPTLTQGISNNNTYTLSWEPVKGAVEYRVYERFGNNAYQIECITSQTSVTVEDFKSQKKSEHYDDLVEQDLKNAGHIVDDYGYAFMNSGVKFTDDFDGYFTVVAVDSYGKQSGISNIVNVRDIANRLPYRVSGNIVMNIESTMDAPQYVDVEMIDGSTTQMLINYHGAQTYRYDDKDKIVISPHIYNTLFDAFLVELHGVDYDLFLSEAKDLALRQDELNKTGGSTTPLVTLPGAPSNETSEDDENARESVEKFVTEPENKQEMQESNPSEVIEEENTEHSVEPVSEEINVISGDENSVITQDGYTTYDIYLAAVQEVESRLVEIGDIKSIIYANNQLEAWISYCLVTQMNIIPVPVCVYPETANQDYLARVLMEAYRQNPTSGVITNIGFSYEYESLVVQYAEETNTRISKTIKELFKAKELADQIVTPSMSDIEKIIAINDYLCTNASYDYDSCATDVDMNNLSEKFIDAHTPYGILINNYGVCESYSEAFALIGRYAGLDVIIETGTLQGGGHEWNRVNVDGSWCILDVTNNDSEFACNALLNITESQAEGFLVPDGCAYMSAHPANDSSKEYYYTINRYAESLEEAVDMLSEEIMLNDISQIRVPLGTSELEAAQLVQQVMSRTGIKLSNAVYFANVVAIVK